MKAAMVEDRQVPQRMEAPVLEFRGISYGYGGPAVIRHIDFAVFGGQVVTLLGPSGCGKSTLLNLAAGLARPYKGTMLFQGEPLTGVNTSVGYLTQDDTLLPWETTWSNVALPLKIKKLPKREIVELVDQQLEAMGLTEAAKKFPSSLSGGMKRRALLARSLVTEPAMLMMDEPFAALDARLREQLQAELRHTVEALNQTVLFVTHDLPEAVALSDRVLVMGGRPHAEVVGDIDISLPRPRPFPGVLSSQESLDYQRRLRPLLEEITPEVS